MRDENDAFMSQGYFTFNEPVVQAMAPLRIGYAAGRRHYEGKLDNIKIYNYAAAGLAPTSVEQGKDAGIPREYALSQNYPNPFNPTTVLNYSVPKNQNLTITVYDIMDRKVKTLVDKTVSPGRYTINWDGTNELDRRVASGVYFCRLKSKDVAKVRKMMLVR